MEKINWNECTTKWGKHPEWGLSLHHVDGEIIGINEDGTYDVKYYHPMDGYGTMNRRATAELENTDYWLSDDAKARTLERARNRLEIGDHVHVNEYRNLFYIYTWKKVYDWGMAHLGRLGISYEFKSGDPHLGHRIRHTIDIGS